MTTTNDTVHRVQMSETIHRVHPVGLITPEIEQIRKALKQRLATLDRILETAETAFVGRDDERDAFLELRKYSSVAEIRKTIETCERTLDRLPA